MERLTREDPVRIGNHVLVARLGAGGMGQVYLGRTPAGTPIAIKVIHEHLARDPRFRARFRREVANARLVSGAFTAPVLEADPEASTPWLATAYLPGLSLQEAVQTHGPFPVEATLALAAGLAEGLDSIHRAGVVHRDLKPSNVLLSGEGPRIIDFGIARAADDHALTRPGGVLGTPGYMSPEQAAGQEVGPAGDVFALGAVLGFTAVGRRVFGDGPLPVMIHRVLHEDPDLDAIPDALLRGLVADCLVRNPALRPTSAMLLDRLSWAGTAPTGVGWLPAPLAEAVRARQAQPPPATMVLPRRVRRRRLLIVGGLAAVGAASAGLGELNAWQRSRTETPTRPPETPAAAAASPAGDGPSTGRVRWRLRNARTAAAPVTDARTAYVVGLAGDLLTGGEGALLAVDVRSGKQRWKRDIKRSYRRVALDGETVVAVEKGALGDTASWKLTAFGAADGKRRWSVPLGGPMDQPLAADGLVFAAEGALIAFDLRTGTERWRRSLGWTASGPVLTAGGGALCVLTKEELRVFQTASGATVWSHRGEGMAAALLDAGTVYVTDADDRLHAVRQGKVGWSVPAGKVVRPPVVYGDTVVVQDMAGFVRAFDRATGKQRFAVPVQAGGSDTATAPLARIGGTLYAPGGDTVHAVDLDRGRLKWRVRLNAEIDGLAAADGAVICSTGDLVAVTGP
ncbi:serine/threonine-protein kinase [Spirillospora sp. NPDC048819]|uniref:serine/threonine-protein kinase n=1 Tax=Spirillospora sp. NPDC048819 TaxID=3155268 RepID=UPI0033C74AB1